LFSDWDAGFYEHTKLANLYTAFEMQRRWARSCTPPHHLQLVLAPALQL
jgi:hypothetical protein